MEGISHGWLRMIYILLRVADLLLVWNYYYYHPHPSFAQFTVANFDWLRIRAPPHLLLLPKTDISRGIQPSYPSLKLGEVTEASLRFMPQWLANLLGGRYSQ